MKWTYKDEFILRENYENKTHEELSVLFPNRSRSSIVQKANVMGLRKNKSITASEQFRNGLTPWNKNTKGVMKPNKTSFVKGQKSSRTRSIGELSVRNCKGINYVYVKTSDGKWIQQQKVNWEKINGKIPKGMILVCLDGNSENTKVENWKAITRGENMKRNTDRKKAVKTKKARRLLKEFGYGE